MQVKSFDLETFLISRLRPAPTPVCLSWHDGKRGAVIPHGPALRDWFERNLTDPSVAFVGHNVAYDMAVMLAAYPDLGPAIFAAYAAGRVLDTGIRQQLFFIATRPSFDDSVPSYSLAALVKLIFDTDISAGKGPDAWRMRYGELYGVPFEDWPDEAIEYPLSDADWTWRCWAKQDEAAADKIRCDADMAYAAFGLTLMSMRGMRTWAVAVDACERRWLGELERLRPLLLESGMLAVGGTKKAPRLVKKRAAAQARVAAGWAALHAQQQAEGTALTAPFLTDGAEEKRRKAKDDSPPRPDELAIDKAACVAIDDPIMLDRARYVLAEKILSTYVPPMRAGTAGPITTRFNLASTMRTTSSEPKGAQVGTNLQNAPRDGGVRECIVPRDGYVLLTADLASAELHTLAQVCLRLLGHSTLGELLRASEDAHLYLACKLLGIPFDADAKQRKAENDPVILDARQRAKPGNFGFGGAMGWAKFILYNLRQAQLYNKHGRPAVNALRFAPSEAQELRRAWLEAYPEMQEYFNMGKRELGESGSCVIELWPGGPLRRVKGLSMWANSRFQAPAAAGAKRAICAVTREAHIGRLQRVYPINFVHDELVAELQITTPDQMHEDAMLFGSIMQDAFNTMVPDYPTRVEPVLATCYSKAAKPVHDAQGRLIPWRPKD